MRFEVKVVSNSSKSDVQKRGDKFKVKVKAKPLKGKANQEVVSALADYFEVSKNSVKIVCGLTSSKKVVEIT